MTFHRGYRILFLFLALAWSAAADPLADGFADPPASAKPRIWWHWLNGNITKEGITADLEAMQRVGLAGATIANVNCSIPAGPVTILGDSWWEMMGHAEREAQRLGLDLGTFNCPGWSSSGGPWVTPEYAMQRVVYSEQSVQGPASFSAVLPQPQTRLGFYRDIAVLAFPSLPAEAAKMVQFDPKITWSGPAADAAKVIDGDRATVALLPLPKPNAPQFLQIELARPFAARTLMLTPSSAMGGCSGEIQASDDGEHYRTLRPFSIPAYEATVQVFGLAPTTARFYRMTFTKAGAAFSTIPIAEVELRAGYVLDNLANKTALTRDDNFAPDVGAGTASDDSVIPSDRIVDLTHRMEANGKLAWDVPSGNWTILRFGYTPTGSVNAPAPQGGEGLECDKLSRAAAEKAWAGMMTPVVQRAGDLAGPGRTLQNVVIDSYERGSQNWTAGFEDEFRKRRGYDLLPYLPTLTGRLVGGAEVSERFLHDFRQTIAEMFSENYYDYFAVMAHRAGLKLQVEPYGNGPFLDLRAARDADLVMGEFWQGGGALSTLKIAASVAHTYGKQLVGSESLTSKPGNWSDSPATLKRWGDAAFATGINYFYLHSYPHQPWLDRAPVMTLGPYGNNFGRTNTWWEQSAAWLRYLARCQYLLQQGRYVADVLYFCGEEAPVGLGPMTPRTPAGYASDVCDADVLLHRLSVKDGRLTLPDGMSYRILVLPPGTKTTPELLKKIGELADAGATIVGPKPLQSPSLSGYPQCDQEVARLADALWNGGKIKSVTALTLGVPPDFEIGVPSPELLYLHRSAGEKEIYFIANQGDRVRAVEGRFRVSGKMPELWHPDTGERESLPLYTEADGVTWVPLRLDPTGSIFVVFDKPATGDHPVSLTRADPPESGAGDPVLEIRHASYEAVDGSGAADVTVRVAQRVQKGSLSLSADSTTLGGDPAPMRLKQLRVNFVLDGKEQSKTVAEGAFFEIASESGSGFPDARLTSHDDEAPRLTAWRAGHYQVKTSADKTFDIPVADLPAPVEVAGPWALSFLTPGTAPLTLDRLVSWSDRPEPQVKYYSGTALYEKVLQVPSGLRGPNQRLYLDLGNVQALAQVKLNGKDLGILWKKPFRVEVTDAVQEGDNRLEVRVTNLWPNRLIGDAHLPDDAEWDGAHLKKWPDWFLQGKPSPTGRVTFATWKNWNQDDALLPSGLLGPVVLYPASEKSVP